MAQREISSQVRRISKQWRTNRSDMFSRLPTPHAKSRREVKGTRVRRPLYRSAPHRGVLDKHLKQSSSCCRGNLWRGGDGVRTRLCLWAGHAHASYCPPPADSRVPPLLGGR